MQPHAYLLDAFLVLNEQLNTWDVDVEPRSLRRTLNWSVYTAIVLAANTHGNDTYSQVFQKYMRYLKCYFLYTVVIKTKTMPIKAGSYLISISARLFASIRRQYLN